MLKFYILIGIVLSVGIGSWSARGWYEDGKVVTALKIQKKEYEKQAAEDAEVLSKALIEQERMKNEFEGIKHEASKIKLCTDDGRDFLRLFNRGAVAANKTPEASSISHPP